MGMSENFVEGCFVADISGNRGCELITLIKYRVDCINERVRVISSKTVDVDILVEYMQRGLKVENFEYDNKKQKLVCTQGVYRKYRSEYPALGDRNRAYMVSYNSVAKHMLYIPYQVSAMEDGSDCIFTKDSRSGAAFVSSVLGLNKKEVVNLRMEEVNGEKRFYPEGKPVKDLRATVKNQLDNGKLIGTLQAVYNASKISQKPLTFRELMKSCEGILPDFSETVSENIRYALDIEDGHMYRGKIVVGEYLMANMDIDVNRRLEEKFEQNMMALYALPDYYGDLIDFLDSPLNIQYMDAGELGRKAVVQISSVGMIVDLDDAVIEKVFTLNPNPSSSAFATFSSVAACTVPLNALYPYCDIVRTTCSEHWDTLVFEKGNAAIAKLQLLSAGEKATTNSRKLIRDNDVIGMSDDGRQFYRVYLGSKIVPVNWKPSYTEMAETVNVRLVTDVPSTLRVCKFVSNVAIVQKDGKLAINTDALDVIEGIDGVNLAYVSYVTGVRLILGKQSKQLNDRHGYKRNVTDNAMRYIYGEPEVRNLSVVACGGDYYGYTDGVFFIPAIRVLPELKDAYGDELNMHSLTSEYNQEAVLNFVDRMFKDYASSSGEDVAVEVTSLLDILLTRYSIL